MSKLRARIKLPRNKSCSIYYTSTIKPLFGVATLDTKNCRVDLNPQQSEGELINTVVHEMLHQLNWRWGEDKVDRHATAIAQSLERLGFTRPEHLLTNRLEICTEDHACVGVQQLYIDNAVDIPTGKKLHWFVVRCGEDVVAAACLKVCNGHGKLVSCAVTETFRGSGIQLELIWQRVRKARRLGLKYVIAETGHDDKYSLVNLIKFGFTIVKIDEDGYRLKLEFKN